jgi:hypothetical protein
MADNQEVLRIFTGEIFILDARLFNECKEDCPLVFDLDILGLGVRGYVDYPGIAQLTVFPNGAIRCVSIFGLKSAFLGIEKLLDFISSFEIYNGVKLVKFATSTTRYRMTLTSKDALKLKS